MTTKIHSGNSLLSAAFVLFMTVFLSACRPDNSSIPTISCDDVVSETTWTDRGDGVDYVVNCVISVNAKLTIEPGVTIQFGPGAGILIETSGSLSAMGTASSPIVFKSENDVTGVWKGLYFKSNNVLNELNYCTVSNAGASSFDGNITKLANVRVALSAKLKLQNSTISKSAKDGLLVDGLDSDELNPITQFSNNTFSGNQNFPISALGSIAHVLDGTVSTFTGNTYNKVLLRGGRLFGTHIWKKMNVPYLVQSIVSVGYYTDNGNLTIEPGVTVQFAADAGLCTGDYSTGSWLKANGTLGKRITFAGETSSSGAWKGIAFQSLSANNQISYADISDGGSSSYTGATQKRANLHGGAWSAGTFTIANSTVTNSEAWGIWVTLGSPAISVPGSVTYSGNVSGNYYSE
ncbi:MAG: hypothetical protein IPH78_05060 [Bacteroidetes bacterium]|nr:hypothetical protein [Bacteroidota bacterium]